MFDANVYFDDRYNRYLKYITNYYISSVVVQECLVGCEYIRISEKIAIYDKEYYTERVIVPDYNDWKAVGKCMSFLNSNKHIRLGGITKPELSMLVKDALIASSAGRNKALVITENIRDFQLICDNYFKSTKYQSAASYFDTR